MSWPVTRILLLVTWAHVWENGKCINVTETSLELGWFLSDKCFYVLKIQLVFLLYKHKPMHYSYKSKFLGNTHKGSSLYGKGKQNLVWLTTSHPMEG